MVSGSYSVKVSYADYGLADCSGMITVTTTQPTILPTVAGFNGGQLTLNGRINPYGKLTINNFIAALIAVTDVSATVKIPPLITS